MENQQERIVIILGVRSGKPYIKGTRISVSDILRMLSADMSKEDILEEYPQLVKEDILASISFANKKEETT